MYTRIERQPPSWGHLPQKAGTIIRRSVGSMVNMELLNYRLRVFECVHGCSILFFCIFVFVVLLGMIYGEIWFNIRKVDGPYLCVKVLIEFLTL